MINSINGLDGTQELLIKLLEQNPDDWGMRKKVVWFLYEAGYFREASKVVWNAPEIPPVDKEIVFAARIVSKGQPTRAMRLLNAVMERNRSEPEKNLAMAKELVKGGMPLQGTRFYGAATLSDSSLIDEDFEVSLITTDAEEEDWTEIVQSDEFPWDGPVELTEADLACEDDDDAGKVNDDMMAGLTQPVPLKAPVQSMKDTVKDEEKAVDLRVPQTPRPLNPDKISTAAVAMSVQNQEDDSEEEDVAVDLDDTDQDIEGVDGVEDTQDDEASTDSSDDSSEEVSSESEQDEDLSTTEQDEDLPTIEHLKDHTGAVTAVSEIDDEQEEEDDDASSEKDTEVEATSEDLENSEAPDDESDSELVDEPAAAKKGVFSSLMGFFKRSKKAEVQSDADILSTPDKPEAAAPKPSALIQAKKPEVKSTMAAPIVGPVKPKPVSAPVDQQGTGGRKFGQPEAIDCRTRLVALAPQDGSAFFTELKEKYATASAAKNATTVKLARDEADVDYLDLVEKACSNDKAVNLDAFSQLLGLHTIMTEAECSEWTDDMNILRQGFGDAVLATVVSKYSVTECREILGAVYRRTATQAAV